MKGRQKPCKKAVGNCNPVATPVLSKEVRESAECGGDREGFDGPEVGGIISAIQHKGPGHWVVLLEPAEPPQIVARQAPFSFHLHRNDPSRAIENEIDLTPAVRAPIVQIVAQPQVFGRCPKLLKNQGLEGGALNQFWRIERPPWADSAVHPRVEEEELRR